MRCSSCSETFRSAHSLLKHAQFTHKINIFIENNSIENDDIKTRNEIFIDVISASATNKNNNSSSNRTNNTNTPNYSTIEKQLFDITVSASPLSSSSSEKIYDTPNKTECTSQHLVYQNESTSSSSTSSVSNGSISSIDSTNIKLENQSNLSQHCQQQNFYQTSQQAILKSNEITSLITNLDSAISMPSKRTSIFILFTI